VDEQDSATTIIGLQALKRTKPAWFWLQRNFSLASVLTIAGMCMAFGGYIVSLKTRVVVLEHEVVHITRIVPDSAMLGAVTEELKDHENRISRVERNQDTIDWDYLRNQQAAEDAKRAHHK
jgi:hypothetical protein